MISTLDKNVMSNNSKYYVDNAEGSDDIRGKLPGHYDNVDEYDIESGTSSGGEGNAKGYDSGFGDCNPGYDSRIHIDYSLDSGHGRGEDGTYSSGNGRGEGAGVAEGTGAGWYVYAKQRS